MTERTFEQRRPRTRAAVFACIVIIALAIDQLTKYWALTHLSAGQRMTIIPNVLSLVLVRNPGASLGMGSNMTWLISVLAIVSCIVLLWLVVRTTSLLWTACLSLAFAGAFGNLIDRVIYATGFMNGKVVDFLNYGWSVGNIADVWLTLAGVAIVLLILTNVPFRRSAHIAKDAASTDSSENKEHEQV